jgi:FKBP-type peptidyl-prolyl cis-trans isomerase SlyD
MMNAQIVSFHCVLKNKLGQVLSSSFNRDVINQLDVRGSNAGERRHFVVPAEEAYGPYDPKLVFESPRSKLPGGNPSSS